MNNDQYYLSKEVENYIKYLSNKKSLIKCYERIKIKNPIQVKILKRLKEKVKYEWL